MKQKFTSEKNKELKSLKESKFNFKISCLMKKQIFTLMMTLAIVLGLSVSALAQFGGDGLTPGNAKVVAQGSAYDFSVTTVDPDDETYLWTVQEFGFTDANIGIQAGLTNVSASKATITNADAATANVRFDDVPAENTMFAVQCVTSNADCSTIRRFYISVFNFEVDVVLCNATGGDENPDNAERVNNDWNANVVDNAHSSVAIQAMNQALINNPTDNENKVTKTYYKVKVTLTGTPANTGLEDFKWRLTYSVPGGTTPDFYQVDLVEAQSTAGASVTFNAAGAGGTATDVAADATSEIDVTGQKLIFFPALSEGDAVVAANYVFEVQTHNRLGINDNLYDLQLDAVDLEFGASESYDNGHKEFTAVDADKGSGIYLADGRTGIRTISASPASTVISVTDN
ncbi:hypothetical protein [Roseimarinus sediminis]|uniref:hypothetical protein n=1 Tax=Roseimarinus sediminis TaxID=1610899 RepID=UPI003D218607